MWLDLFVTLLLLACSLLVHEAGHWAVLHQARVPVRSYWLGLGPVLLRVGRWRIGMLPIGAAVEPDAARYAALPARLRVLTALAGPAASALYGTALLWGATALTEVPGAKGLELLGQLNLFIACVNIVPLPPLDGWQAMAALTEWAGRPLHPTTQGWALRLGNGFIYGVGFLVLGKLLFLY